MSRLIVKNLPNGMKEDRFRQMFSDFGTVTDSVLKFTKAGKFRKFGFVGFKSEDDAKKALVHFNRSFVDTSRVTVELCTDFGDPNKARPWSKHSQQAASEAKEPKSHEQKDQEKKKKKPLNVIGDLEEDQKFHEFLAVHQKRNLVPTWANDSVEAATGLKENEEEKKKKEPVKDDYLNFDSDESEEFSGAEEEEEEEEDDEEQKQDASKDALKKDMSDMDYLRSKMVQNSEILDGTDDKEDGPVEEKKEEEEEEEEEEDEEDSSSQHIDSAYESGEKARSKNTMEPSTEFTVKLRGVPFTVKELQIREFMLPLKPVAIRFGKDQDGRRSGYVYVDLQSEAEIERALRLNKDYIGGRYIEVFRVKNFKKDKSWNKESHKERNFVRELKDDEEEEDVAESGRLFIRNLPYTCTEDDLNELFTKHGPLSEIHFPIDGLTKKPKGFAFVTYMVPENAVSALAQLDGHIFQGRMLHVLASRMKKIVPDQGLAAPGSSSYKKQKEAKDKAASGSSHNWNSLFVGTSAVADAVAQKYNTTKSQVLDPEFSGSLAVRLALGETEIVEETRQFLLDNGVSLDSFSQASGQRSKSVILVKNLPSGIEAKEIENLFSPHGSLGRVLLPPSGLTAIVEFLETTEAKRAFMKLAYTKFQHVPLYLEWAPVAVFTSPAAPKAEPKEEEDEEEEEDSLPGSTLFIKNLNFSTSEETLRQTFSKCGTVKSCTISKKRSKTGEMLSMGYGFVQYKSPEVAQKAMKQLQHCMVDEHQLELKVSEKETRSNVVKSQKKKQTSKKQTSSKILVRNVPFQATVKELRELFCTFGELKTVRLPKKGIGSAHRGFGFVDFITKQDAKKAFTALCHSTHLYGRRLVLEWANTDETVEDLRRKTALHFHDTPKKRKKAKELEGILEQMEVGE